MTLHYPFPTINHIDDIIPHITDEGTLKYFRKVDKEGYTFINYNLMMPAVFPPVEGSPEDKLRSKIRRECRGITFDSQTGLIVSRPFHKFFNLGEPSAGDNPNPLHQSHVILEKLDGSMLRPLPNGRWATKMGVTDVALDAETFVAKNWKYQDFVGVWMSHGMTPIFEYVGPHNRVVLEYPENMYLLAMRNNTTGAYFPYEEMVLAARPFAIPFVRRDNRTLDQVKEDDSSEGIVIKYSTGHMLKVKSDWYVKVHRAKELLYSDRRFVEAVVEGTLDDALASFLPDDQILIEEKLKKFQSRFNEIVNTLAMTHAVAREEHDTKKDFAIFSKDWPEEWQVSRSYVFNRWDEKVDNADDFLLTRLKGALGSNTKFEKTMEELGFDL